ncbi:MAG: ABC transporter substrate-binding protein [Thermodesulfobacteriota bacterium]
MRTVLLCCWLLAAWPVFAGERVVDTDGQEIVVGKPFSRIISLYPAHTENLFSLGLEPEVIGVADSDDYPPAVAGKVRYNYREDPEKFIAARPDLVLIRPMIARGSADFVRKLRAAGSTVVSLQPNTPEEIYAYWRVLGILTGREAEAAAMAGRFQRELAAIRARVDAIPPSARKKVYFESIHAKMKTFAPRSIAMFCLESAGGINVAADALQVRSTNIAEYGKERILARGGEIDVFLAQQGRMNPVQIATIVDEPGFGAIRAVEEGRVHLIDEELVSRPTVRLLDGIREIHRLLYGPAGSGS